MIRELAGRLVRRPLLHFLLAGALLAALQSAVGSARRPAPPPVVIDAATVASLHSDWILTTGREPSEEELERAIQDRVDRELLVRAAIDLGLHRTDALVQRRLIQDQRFLEGSEGASTLDDEDLLERALALGLERSDTVVRRRLIERMRQILLAREAPAPLDEPAPIPEPWVRLTQIPLSRDRRGERLEGDAQALLARLRDERLEPGSPALAELGDPLLVPRELPASDRRRLASRLGAGFAEEALAAPIGVWTGPIESAYGLHLVWVHERGSWYAGSVPGSPGTRARERAALERGLQILRRDVDVIRYDRATPPKPGEP